MLVLNLGLQNLCNTKRIVWRWYRKSAEKCNSMDAIRSVKDLNVKQGWMESIKPVPRTMESRFLPLQLKGEPINCTSTVTNIEVHNFERHLKELFPSLDTTKRQKWRLHLLESCTLHWESLYVHGKEVRRYQLFPNYSTKRPTTLAT